MGNAIDALNETFAIDGYVTFDAGVGGLARAVVSNELGEAHVYLHGAHVAAFHPRGAQPVLWMSAAAEFRAGKAIRGGIPVVFPWFGPHPSDAGRPQHGFARTALWDVVSSRALPDGGTEVRLRLDDDEGTYALWPHGFTLELHVAIGSSLDVALVVASRDAAPFTVGAALHTYFSVGDIAQASIEGLSGLDYVDKLDENRIKRQEGGVVVVGEVDRVYLDTPGSCVVDDASFARRIRVSQSGSRSTVVWNPWVEKSRRMPDFPDDGYRHMVCVEAVNTGDDSPIVAPGSAHTLSQSISLVPSGL